MSQQYTMIEDIAFLNSESKTREELQKLYKKGLFENPEQWTAFHLNTDIEGIMDSIKARMKYYMSKLSLGVYNVIDIGPGPNLVKEDEIYLFSGYTEIGTTSKIGDMIMADDYHINPALFPNSVHHISLCYYALLKKITNYCAAITDGHLTNLSFIHFIKNRSQLSSPFVVVTGEEKAKFFDYESESPLDIVNSYAAYKLVPKRDRGFRFCGMMDNAAQIKQTDEYKKANLILTGTNSFKEFIDADKKTISEYPLSKDNPCGIAYRLALPFYLELKGHSIIIEKAKDKYYYFEVTI